MPDSTCRWTDCERPARTRGFCQKHYWRAKTSDNFDDPWLTWTPGKSGRPSGCPSGAKARKACDWIACDEDASIRNFCSMHYGRAERMGVFDRPWEIWQKFPNCVQCGAAFQAQRSTQRHCSDKCAVERWRTDNPERCRELSAFSQHVRRARTRSLPSESFTVQDVRMARGDDCYLCGNRINFKLKRPHPMSPSLDHVTPISRGGGHTLSNAAMTHLVCNMRKGAREAATSPIPTIFTT